MKPVLKAKHLGNVRAVVSDVLKPNDSNSDGTLDNLTADVLSAQDYFAFGQIMTGREYNKGQYRFGFNGKENDNEVNGGVGTTYDYGFRIYDARIGRFLSIDPLTTEYPYWTPYQFAGNNPIQNTDLDGLEPVKANAARLEYDFAVVTDDKGRESYYRTERYYNVTAHQAAKSNIRNSANSGMGVTQTRSQYLRGINSVDKNDVNYNLIQDINRNAGTRTITTTNTAPIAAGNQPADFVNFTVPSSASDVVMSGTYNSYNTDPNQITISVNGAKIFDSGMTTTEGNQTIPVFVAAPGSSVNVTVTPGSTSANDTFNFSLNATTTATSTTTTPTVPTVSSAEPSTVTTVP